MNTNSARISSRLTVVFFLLTLLGVAKGQNPTICANVGSRANSNGQANSCPNVNGTAMASNFTGTPYATVPVTSKTGSLRFDYSGSNPSLTPYAITRVWLTNGGTTIQGTTFGPAAVPAVVGGNTQVSYCFYGSNLATAGTLSFELTNPQTGTVWGICSYDASCNSNCTVVPNPATLPVIYSAFTAVAGPGNTVQLNWTTAQEENNKGFTIERSLGDSAFSAIGFVRTSNPNGNSANPTRYSFTDQDIPPVAEVGYRLRQEDMDGQFHYSAVEVFHLTRPREGVRIYVAENLVKISFPPVSPERPYDMEVYDAGGRQMQRKQITGGTEYTITDLTASALYYVSVKDNKGKRLAVKSVYIK